MIDPIDSKDFQRLENLLSNLCFELIQTNQTLINLEARILTIESGDRAAISEECQQIISRIERLRTLTRKKQ